MSNVKAREFEIPDHTTSSEYSELFAAYEALEAKMKIATEALEIIEQRHFIYGQDTTIREALNKIRGE